MLEIENTSRVGTPFYLAPELLFSDTRQSYSVKSDVWALGVILYELCALKKPFLGANEEDLYIKIRDDKISPIPNLSKDLMDLLE
jgi:NIMA (never in mitosis gene a)-related kinase